MKTYIPLFIAMMILQGVAYYSGYRAGHSNGYQEGASRPLSLIDRRNIAIEYACSPEQHWRMMKFFCGSVK